jgi:hypothetical protein
MSPTSRTLGDSTVWPGQARANYVTFRSLNAQKKQAYGPRVRFASIGANPT